MMSLGGQFLFRVIRRRGCRPARIISTIDTALGNAAVEISDEARVVKPITGCMTSVSLAMFVHGVHYLIAKQWISLSFRSDGIFIMAVILICSSVREVLMVGFVLVDIIEIMRKVSVSDWWRPSVQRSTTNALKKQHPWEQRTNLFDWLAYGITRQARAADSLNVVTRATRWSRREDPLSIWFHNDWTPAHHHLVGIRWAALPAVCRRATAASAVGLLWRRPHGRWDVLRTRRHCFLM